MGTQGDSRLNWARGGPLRWVWRGPGCQPARRQGRSACPLGVELASRAGLLVRKCPFGCGDQRTVTFGTPRSVLSSVSRAVHRTRAVATYGGLSLPPASYECPTIRLRGAICCSRVLQLRGSEGRDSRERIPSWLSHASRGLRQAVSRMGCPVAVQPSRATFLRVGSAPLSPKSSPSARRSPLPSRCSRWPVLRVRGRHPLLRVRRGRAGMSVGGERLE